MSSLIVTIFCNIENIRTARTLRRNLIFTISPDLNFLLRIDNSSATDINLCWAMAKLCPTKLLDVEIDCPSWKVFHACLSPHEINATSIGYCPFLRASPTDPSVVREALNICIRNSQKLGMKYTVVTQDEAVYEISYTLRKTNPEEYPNLILRLGGFTC